MTFLVLFLAGCSLLGEDGEARVEFRLWNNDLVGPDFPVRIRFEDFNRSRSLTVSDLVGPDGPITAGPFETKTFGVLTVTAQLLDENGNAASAGKVILPLESDREYSVWVAVGEVDPRRSCFGCQGSQSFAIEPDLGFGPRDSLFIVWGGNSISNPVIY